jgi:adenine-methyltransferase
MKNAKRQGVDFGEWDKDFNLFDWIKLYSPLVKDDGSFIIFCSYRYISYIIDELEKNDFIVKDIIEWKKSNPMPRNINRRYVQDTEFAVWAVKKNAKWTFNKPDDVSYLRSTFTTSVVSGKEKVGHPTQKSLELMRQIIKIHTNEDDLILDCFMGSGTTGVACLLENRKFIGIEKDAEYFNIASNRIN